MFTPSQIGIIKADILANADMNTLPLNLDGAFEIARLYNLEAVPVFKVWASNVKVKDIYDAITWTNYTSSDAPEASGMYTARAMAIQTKQMNLQNMLQGHETIDATKSNIRAGLRDAVIQLPAGTNGAMVSAGGSSGATVLNACLRNATRLEKLLTIGTATTGTTTSNLMGFEGKVSPQQIEAVRNN